MHSVYKFTSKEVDSKFNFKNWLMNRANEILEDSKKKLADYKITKEEEDKLLKLLVEEKGMTLHFYFAGNITEGDIKKLRGYAEPVKVKDEDKCGMCKCLLTSPTKGDIKDKDFPNLCKSCGDAKRALSPVAVTA